MPILLLLTLLAAAAAPAAAQARPNEPAALAVLDRAVARMGGDSALRAVRTIRMDVLTQWQRTTFGTYPYADQPSYERHADLRDYATASWRNTRDFLGQGRTVDVVADSVTGRWLTGPDGSVRAMPMNRAYVQERREQFAFAPERTLLLARDAGGLRRLADTTIAGVVHARLAGSADGFPTTWFVRATDGLLAMARFTADETDDFGLAPWGVQEVEVWYSAWTTVKPGLTLPRQRDVRRLGLPYRRMTALTIAVGAPAPADSFAIPDSIVTRYLATERRPMWAAPLDDAKVVERDFATFAPWFGTSGAVRVGGEWVLVETGQADGAAALLDGWLTTNAGGPARLGIVARTGTGNGGARWFARQGRPLLVAPGANAMVRHIIGSAARGARPGTVTKAGWVKVGTDSLWAEPVDLPDAPGELAVYVPALRWVYLSTAGVPAYKPEFDALVARLRARGLPVEWMGWARAFRVAVPPAS